MQFKFLLLMLFSFTVNGQSPMGSHNFPIDFSNQRYFCDNSFSLDAFVPELALNYCLGESSKKIERNDSRPLYRDFKLCDCLNESIGEFKLASYSFIYLPPNLYSNSADFNENIFKENIEDLNKNLQTELNARALQAYSLVGNEDINPNARDNFVSMYSPAPFPEPKIDLVESGCTTDGVCSDPGTLNQAQEVFGETFKGPEKIESDIFEDGKKTVLENQCISPREFFINQSLPSEEILAELKNINSQNFNQTDWDYLNLLKEIKKPDQEVSKEEKEKIKARLIFLNRNPMLKTFLASNTNNDHLEYLKKNLKLTPDDKSFEEHVFRDEAELKKKKLELINKISSVNLVGPNRNNQIEDYFNSLKDFFSDKDMVSFMSIEGSRQSYRKIADLMNDPSSFYNTDNNSSPQARYKDIQGKFTAQQPFVKSPMECRMNFQDDTKRGLVDRVSQECLKTFSLYCPAIKPFKDDKIVEVGDSEVNHIENILKNDFNFENLAHNEDFIKMNQEVCGHKRYKNLTMKLTNKGGKTFLEFKDEYCKKQTADKTLCDNSVGSVVNLRKIFFKEYDNGPKTASEALDRLHSIANIASSKLNPTPRSTGDVINLSNDFFDEVFKGTVSTSKIAKSVIFSPDSSEKLKSEDYANQTTVSSSTEPVVNNVLGNFSQMSSLPDFESPENTEKQVQDMSKAEKEKLLSDWEKQYADWKKNEGNNPSSTDKSHEKSLIQEIETLRLLLDQQQKVNDQQFKMLNEAIAAKNQKPKTDDNKNDKNKATRDRAAEYLDPSSSNLSGTGGNFVNRAPANVAGSQSSLGPSGYSAASSSATSSASLSGASRNSEALSREQSKLINLRRAKEGGIYIESTSGSAGTANAIQLKVSNEVYDALKTNPSQFNLNQIESKIPEYQLLDLEKKGKKITIILSNGSNPPFEILVERSKGKLLYSLKSDKKASIPVRRKYTRDALSMELKAQN